MNFGRTQTFSPYHRDSPQIENICSRKIPLFITHQGFSPRSKSFLFLFYLFIYFWLHWVFVAAQGLSLVASSRDYSSLQCAGFLLWLLLLLWSMSSRCAGFSICGTRAQQLWLADSRAQAQQLWHTGLVAPWHVGSSWTRDRNHVRCIGRQILNHCDTREVPQVPILSPVLMNWVGQNAVEDLLALQRSLYVSS